MFRRALGLLGIALVCGYLGYLIGSNALQLQPIAYTPPPSAAFLVGKLSICPAEVEPNEAVTITVSVANENDTWGLYSLVLMIDGVKETEGQVIVDAGSTQDITFSVMRADPGSYSVFINGLSGSFPVVAPREEEVKAEVVFMEVEVLREVEVIKEVPVKLRHFESVQELKDWFQQVDKRVTMASSGGVTELRGGCEDVAIDLQDKAMGDGYKMSIEVLGRDEYHKWYGEWLEKDRLHAINSVIIGNEFWFIDFLADKVWLGAYLDDPR